MVEELLPGLYRIEVPLPRNPLRSINSYVIKAPGRSLVVDSGLNLPECLKAWKEGLDEIGLQEKDVDFFITHMHSDHLALATTVASDNTTLYIGEYDEPAAARAAEVTQNIEYWRPRLNYAARNGFPRTQLGDTIKHHPSFTAGPSIKSHFTPLRDGAVIDIGDYHFTCVWTPGHSNGHLCLYEPEKNILLSGDHILGSITPVISCWQSKGNPLGEYLESLTKIERLDVKLALPGHRRMIHNLNGRIAELRRHHQARLDEILHLLQQREQTAYEVASGMSWNIKFRDWNSSPPSQQWFATGEAMSHLRYLVHRDMVKSDERDGLIVYSTN